MSQTFRTFFLPVLVWVIALVAMFIWGGFHAFLITALLTVLEVTLSFDNAVVNAKILARMNAAWQKRFLTWGILVAVVGTRLILPILIVAASAAASPLVIAALAVNDPEGYGHLLEGARVAISAFGGTFLLMVSLKYFFDGAKDVHWIHAIERHMARWGRVEAIEIGIALALLAVFSALVPAEAGTILLAGIIGIILFIAMQGIASAFDVESAAAGSVALFIYLNVLDAAFSLDGVVGAFAITSSLPAIVIGLGVGAYFVRTLTVYLVRQKTLDTLTYLEHGAHWAILGLAAAMFVSMFAPVPELITGLVGIVFVGAAYYSSLKKRNAASV